MKDEEEEIEEMNFTVVSSHTPPKIEDSSWDADSAEASIRRWAGGPDKENIDWEKYAKGFAWYDGDDRENFTSYKLPHHKIQDGTLKTSERGVIAAGNAVSGARGGVDIPSGEMSRVRSHLAKHYGQFDRTPPWKEEEQESYNCECIECGYTEEMEEHCREVECPECGGEMRRVERPGAGYQDEQKLQRTWTQEEAEDWLKEHDFKYSGTVAGDNLPEDTGNWWAYRQEDPDKYDDFREVDDILGFEPGDGVHFVIGIKDDDEEEEGDD